MATVRTVPCFNSGEGGDRPQRPYNREGGDRPYRLASIVVKVEVAANATVAIVRDSIMTVRRLPSRPRTSDYDPNANNIA